MVHLVEEICINLVHSEINTKDCKMKIEFHEKGYGFKLAQDHVSLIAVHHLTTSVGFSIIETCIIKLVKLSSRMSM